MGIWLGSVLNWFPAQFDKFSKDVRNRWQNKTKCEEMSLLKRTMFLCQITVVVVFMSGTSLVNGKQEAASKVNYCLTSALQISSVQDLKNVVFEECIHQQIQNENVSLQIIFVLYIKNILQIYILRFFLKISYNGPEILIRFVFTRPWLSWNYIWLFIFFLFQGYFFNKSQLTATLNLLLYFKITWALAILLEHMHMKLSLRKIGQRLRVAVSQE